jgi:DNA modification methylase
MILCADARNIPLRDETIQCCITSPPYWGLRDYGNPNQLGLEKTPEEYVANMVAVFREVRRVLKDDGVLWLNLGDSYIGGGRRMKNEGISISLPLP